jgi:hypothetical protein
MSDTDGLRELVVLDQIVPAGKPWGYAVRQGEILLAIWKASRRSIFYASTPPIRPTRHDLRLLQ